ncbi:transglycosylase SLT domain-containing protein [Dokdonella ginsengisoli]|uniref:Transglycosylase SLT domain-containing protein n=1 Tax=Dokdonella ginsengisoli TaxID=363846 RepID=A0ABV9QXC1_9GAMM
MSRRTVARLRTGLLGAGVAVLAACSAPVLRPPVPAPPPSPAPPPPRVADVPIRAPSLDGATAAPESPWARLRSRFAMQACDYRPGVQRWARSYARGSRAFTASWERAMPVLLLVVDEIEKRDLPGEFAMLPYVESGYQPVAPRGDRPAGMWQLMPDTARGSGLAVDKDYDGRLDPLASTRVALDLIERYRKEFADWRLANMAFNSGEFRVKKLLGERDPRTLSAEELGKVAFNPITHEHLDRLLALACIVEDPQRFGIELPEPSTDDRLQSVDLKAGMDLRLAARLSGVEIDDLRRWNAGYRRNRMSADAKPRLLLPATHADRFLAAADSVPVAYWSDWCEQPAARSGGLGSWAAQIGVPVAVLALANSIDENSTVTHSTRLLLPGREPEPLADTRSEPARRPRTHVIASGDTLSAIARRYGLSLKDLRRWNPRAHGTLHLGDRLRLGPTAD